MDPRGFPTTLPEFQRVFPDEEACARYLERLRWPEQSKYTYVLRSTATAGYVAGHA